VFICFEYLSWQGLKIQNVHKCSTSVKMQHLPDLAQVSGPGPSGSLSCWALQSF